MIIYKFEHNGNCYIGSTKNLKMRCHAHNQHKKQPRHNRSRFYQYLLANNIYDIKPYVEIINEFENDYDKFFLRNQEQDLIDEYKPNLNMVKAIRR